MAKPEKLNLWDRFFNRYRKEVHKRGQECWFTWNERGRIKGSERARDYVEYLVIDRLTGSETIEKVYL